MSNLNLAHFARMAAPSPPPQGYSRMASQSRGGDSLMAHMTPGEIAALPHIQTPEVLAALNRAFAQMGANPTSFQGGNPEQKINPILACRSSGSSISRCLSA